MLFGDLTTSTLALPVCQSLPLSLPSCYVPNLPNTSPNYVSHTVQYNNASRGCSASHVAHHGSGHFHLENCGARRKASLIHVEVHIKRIFYCKWRCCLTTVCAATDRPGWDSIGKLDKGEKKTMLVRSLFAAAQSLPLEICFKVGWTCMVH